MTQINDTCRGGRPSGARRPGADRLATRRTRVRVSSDAVLSAYIHDIARPHARGERPVPLMIPSPSRMAMIRRGGQGGDRGFARIPSRA